MQHALLGVGFGALEIGVILLVALLIFGPSKLPQLGEGIGKMLRGFKKEMRAMEDDKKSAADDDPGEEIDVTPKPPLASGAEKD
jgi:sec-independent protein translocase protein TatA